MISGSYSIAGILLVAPKKTLSMVAKEEYSENRVGRCALIKVTAEEKVLNSSAVGIRFKPTASI